jgi:predicted ester cyclase
MADRHSPTAGTAAGIPLRELLEKFYKGFSGDTALIDQTVTPDWEDLPPHPGQEPGPDGIKPLIENIGGSFANFSIAIHDVVDGRATDGNGLVGVRGAMLGTHIGEMFGVPATGREYSITIHEFHEIRDGRIARTWHLEDWFGWRAEATGAPSTEGE